MGTTATPVEIPGGKMGDLVTAHVAEELGRRATRVELAGKPMI
jgi:hypothetical protein